MNTSTAGLSPRSLPQLQDTIVALSSAAGAGARAIVRLSGPEAWGVAVTCFERRPAKLSPGRWPGAILIPDLGRPIPAELYVWAGPRSYTGQDLVEIHCLSSPPLVEALLALLLTRGARAAQPGEYTMRAFLAGKLDLTQVEAVSAVIAAESGDDLRSALRQLAGGVAKPLQYLRDELLAVLAEVEAGLDFVAEDLTFIAAEELVRRLRAAVDELEQLRKQLERRAVSGRPFRIVLAGPPNAGKSSLFNALLGDARALVSPEAGTTRDYLSARLTMDGIEIELIDTAGHEGSASDADQIRVQAQEVRRQQVAEADLILLCRDPTAGKKSGDLTYQYSTKTDVLKVATKCDLAMPRTMANAELPTSAHTGQGLADLQHRLATIAQTARRSDVLAASWGRCSHLVESGRAHVAEATTIATQSQFPELIALELRAAIDDLGEIVGAVYTDDLLDRIFSQFCIGK